MGERGTPRLTSDEIAAILRRGGFKLAGTAGSHQKWRNTLTGKQVIVPHHRGRILPLGTMLAREYAAPPTWPVRSRRRGGSAPAGLPPCRVASFPDDPELLHSPASVLRYIDAALGVDRDAVRLVEFTGEVSDAAEAR